MGGFGGAFGGGAPAGLLKGDLAALFNPASMRNQQIKRGLLNAGIALMNPDPITPPSFGASIGRAASGAFQGADQARQDFYNDGMRNVGLMEMQRKQEAQMQEQREKQKQKEAIMSWVNTLPPEQQKLAEAFPEQAAKAFLESQTGGGSNEYGLNPVWTQDGEGKWHLYQPNKGGGDPRLMNFGGNTPQPTQTYLNQGTQFMQAPNRGALPQNPATVPIDNTGKAAQTTAGELQGAAAGNLPGAIQSAEFVKTKIDDLLKNPNIDKAIGYGSWLGDAFVSNEVIDIRGRIKELSGGAFLEARQMLKGGGAITDFESTKAEQAYSRMEQAMRSSDEKMFKEALLDFRSALDAGVNKLRATAGQPTVAPTQNQADPLSIR